MLHSLHELVTILAHRPWGFDLAFELQTPYPAASSELIMPLLVSRWRLGFGGGTCAEQSTLDEQVSVPGRVTLALS